MIIDFKNINDFVISLTEFSLSWRFIDSKYNALPDYHLESLKPLDKVAAKFLYDYIKTMDLHKDIPFKIDIFKHIDSIEIKDNNDNEVKDWLLKYGLDSNDEIFLSWDIDNAMIIPFGLLVEYFDDFYYSSSDNLTVFQKDLNWALLFFHTDIIYFGTR
jgi:hypothetical protein